MNLALEGKVAIVTGGDKGIGRGISDALVDEGCSVCICSRHEDEVQQAAKELVERGTDGVRALAVVADLTEVADRQKLVEETMREFGTIDILINNAGTVGGGRDARRYTARGVEEPLRVEPVRRRGPRQARRPAHAGEGLGTHHQRLFGERTTALPGYDLLQRLKRRAGQLLQVSLQAVRPGRYSRKHGEPGVHRNSAWSTP